MFLRYTIIKAFGLHSLEQEGEEHGRNETSSEEDSQESSGEDNCKEDCNKDKGHGKRKPVHLRSLRTQCKGCEPL